MLRKVSFVNLIRKLDTGPKECETTEQESEKIWEQLEVSLSPLLIHSPVRGGPNLSSLRDWSLAQMALVWTGRSCSEALRCNLKRGKRNTGEVLSIEL